MNAAYRRFVTGARSTSRFPTVTVSRRSRAAAAPMVRAAVAAMLLARIPFGPPGSPLERRSGGGSGPGAGRGKAASGRNEGVRPAGGRTPVVSNGNGLAAAAVVGDDAVAEADGVEERGERVHPDADLVADHA